MPYLKRIVCAIPLSWQYVSRVFFLSCLRMREYAAGRYRLLFMSASSCYMDKNRDELVDLVKKEEPDYILWLDADQIYPDNTPEVLMRYVDEGKLIVGGCTPRRTDGEPLIYRFTEWDGRFAIRHVAPFSGMLKVDAMGMGGIMTHPSVFDKLKKPYFKMIWENGYVGEDIQFYRNCKNAGIDVWCDTNMMFGHLDTRAIYLEKPEEKPIIERKEA